MNFDLTKEQMEQRLEFFDVCKKLERKKPADFIGFWGKYLSDECWEYHHYCAKEFAKRGWLSLGWPPEFGGKGTMTEKVLFAEARGYYDIPGVDGFGVDMLAPTLLQVADEKIKKEFLFPIAAAEVTWCELWSEPNAGSDLAALTSTAIKRGDNYVINGQKTWITGAHRADWGFGIFRTGPPDRKHHNLSFLLLKMNTPGITVKPIKYMHGGHIYDEVYFDDVYVPVRNIVGQENEGWSLVNLLAGFERSNIDQIMRMKRWLEELVAYCNETSRNGRLLAKDPLIRNKLAQIACEIEAAQALAYRVADLQSRNDMSLIDSSGIKIFVAELTEHFAYVATDILNKYSQVKSSRWAPLSGLWEKVYQEYFIFSVSMGTNEIQKNIIAWYGLGLPRMK